jgi:hypothetical protein
MRGTIVEVTCFRQQGAATGQHTRTGRAAPRSASPKDGRLGILTEGDGLFQITAHSRRTSTRSWSRSSASASISAAPKVIISNNYDYKSFDAEKDLESEK